MILEIVRLDYATCLIGPRAGGIRSDTCKFLPLVVALSDSPLGGIESIPLLRPGTVVLQARRPLRLQYYVDLICNLPQRIAFEARRHY